MSIAQPNNHVLKHKSFFSYSALDGRCSRCADGSIIPSSALCDGIIDCPDLSDECRCQNPISICDAVTPILSK